MWALPAAPCAALCSPAQPCLLTRHLRHNHQPEHTRASIPRARRRPGVCLREKPSHGAAEGKHALPEMILVARGGSLCWVSSHRGDDQQSEERHVHPGGRDAAARTPPTQPPLGWRPGLRSGQPAAALPLRPAGFLGAHPGAPAAFHRARVAAGAHVKERQQASLADGIRRVSGVIAHADD